MTNRPFAGQRISILAVALLLLSLVGLPYAGRAADKKVNIAYSSISGNMAPLWIAYESGFFRKYGLDVQLILIEGGSQAVQTLGSGDVAFAQMAGPGVIQAALRGGDSVMIAGVVNTLTFQFIADKEITQPEQLKGRSVAVTRYGSSTDFAIRFALDKYGLRPERDVTILQLGTMPALLAALEGKKIQGAMLSSPFTLKARRSGLRLLADLQMLGLEYQHTGIATTRALLKSQPELARNFMKAYVEGIHYYKTHRKESQAVLRKYLGVDDSEALTEIYEDIGLTLVPEKPYPTLRGIRTILHELAARDPAAANVRAEQFVDMTLVAELDKSGFIDRLYKSLPVVADRDAPLTPAVADKEKLAAEGQIRLVARTSPAPEAKSKGDPPVISAKIAAAEEHTVRAGDTLARLAEKYYGSSYQWEIIYAANKDTIKDPNHIVVGQKIIVPPVKKRSGT
jgi:NitT/TauT family transport system substrate-binding protein